ncbi:MAG: hypothetical protein QM729_07120 [Solirubrobacterales bacterium]
MSRLRTGVGHVPRDVEATGGPAADGRDDQEGQGGDETEASRVFGGDPRQAL